MTTYTTIATPPASSASSKAYTKLATPPSSGQSCDPLQEIPTVLLITGWTDGPIKYLRNRLQNDLQCNIVEPRLLMPPFRGLWCFDMNFCLMCGVVLGLLWGLHKVLFQFESINNEHNPAQQILYFALLFGVLCYWIRLMVAVVCRSAIADGVEKCLQEIRRQNQNVVLCVGFSWGAGVLAELLSRGNNGLDSQPAFLLLAPVSSAQAMAAMREDAAHRLYPLENNDFVHVVHASDDSFFCPNPERWEQVPGIKNHTVHDVHVFKNASSRRTIAELLSTIFRMKIDNNQ